MAYVFWHSIRHSFWHIFWHSIWHSFWHLLRRILWHLFWRFMRHSIWHRFYIDILSGIYSDILYLASVINSDILSGSLSGIVSGILFGICSGPGVAHIDMEFRSRRGPQHPELAIWSSGPGVAHSIRTSPVPTASRAGDVVVRYRRAQVHPELAEEIKTTKRRRGRRWRRRAITVGCVSQLMALVTMVIPCSAHEDSSNCTPK